MANHRLHIEQVGRVGGEVVFDALLVANVYHYVTEGATGATVAHWDGESTLQHILQQSDGLQANGFTSCIRTRDDENGGNGNVNGDGNGNDTRAMLATIRFATIRGSATTITILLNPLNQRSVLNL